MRGVMEFDDYNYNQYNNMVLVPEVKPDKDGNKKEAKDDNESVALSFKTLDRVVDDDYIHDMIDLPLTPA